MRLNQFVAAATGLSRRAADSAIQAGRLTVNGQPVQLGQSVGDHDQVRLDGRLLRKLLQTTTVMLNKPPGYICSRQGQGSRTIYDLLPPEFQKLKPIGRLDKDSSGLLLLTSDGQLANRLAHPRYGKTKVYEIVLDRVLTEPDLYKLEQGIPVQDYVSHLQLQEIKNPRWQVVMTEGHNRQIRRTFETLDYTVNQLHRTGFGDFKLKDLEPGAWKTLRKGK